MENQKAPDRIKIRGGQASTLPELMDMSIDEALAACADLPLVARRLSVLKELGLDYLTLGEETPSLSGGEAQRLKLASEMGKGPLLAIRSFDLVIITIDFFKKFCII